LRRVSPPTGARVSEEVIGLVLRILIGHEETDTS
jgi:hypothetical protein